MHFADPALDDTAQTGAGLKALGVRRRQPTHAVVRAVDGTEGLCPLHVLARRRAGHDGADGEDDIPRLRAHERMALLAPTTASVAAAAAMTFGDGLRAATADLQATSDAESEMHQIEELDAEPAPMDDNVDSRGDVPAGSSLHKQRRREKKTAERQAAVAASITARRAEIEAAQAAKAAALAREQVKAAAAEVVRGGGVWPEDETNGHVAADDNKTRQRHVQRSRNKTGLNAEDAAATALEEAIWQGGDSKRATDAGQRGAIHLQQSPFSREVASGPPADPKQDEKASGNAATGGRPSNEDVRNYSDYPQNSHILQPSVQDDEGFKAADGFIDAQIKTASNVGNTGTAGQSEVTESRRHQHFVELPQQPLGEMFDRRRHSLAHRRRRRRPDVLPGTAGGECLDLNSDCTSDGDASLRQPPALLARGLMASATSTGKKGDDFHKHPLKSRKNNGKNANTWRAESIQEAKALATASLGHFSSDFNLNSSIEIHYEPQFSAPREESSSGVRHLAEVTSAVMSCGERDEVLGGLGNEAKAGNQAAKPRSRKEIQPESESSKVQDKLIY